jgi:hypothetical protein
MPLDLSAIVLGIGIIILTVDIIASIAKKLDYSPSHSSSNENNGFNEEVFYVFHIASVYFQKAIDKCRIMSYNIINL